MKAFFVSIWILLFIFFCAYSFKQAKLKEAELEQTQHLINSMCRSVCYPYTTNMCYTGDVAHIFITCANTPEIIFMKSIEK